MFSRLREEVQLEAGEAIGELAEDPFPFDCKPMEGYADLYRVRFYRGRYRIVYRVKQRSRTVVIERIGPRETIYSGLRKPA